METLQGIPFKSSLVIAATAKLCRSPSLLIQIESDASFSHGDESKSRRKRRGQRLNDQWVSRSRLPFRIPHEFRI
jgi:hypothetical protein